MIGVTANPAPNGSAFNLSYLSYIELLNSEEVVNGPQIWQMDGTGTISNGTASGRQQYRSRSDS